MGEITKHSRYELQYNLKNIRTLLLDTFTVAELQHFCEVTPEFKPISKELLQKASLQQLVHELLTYAERQLKFEVLLALTKEKAPTQYEAKRPYYTSVIVSASVTAKGSDKELHQLQAQFSQATFQQKISEGVALFVQKFKTGDELLYQTKQQEFKIIELLTKEKAADISFTVTVTGNERQLKDLSRQLSQESFRQNISDNLEMLVQTLKEASEEPPKASSFFPKFGFPKLLQGK